MDPEVVWKDDIYITKFLELLLKNRKEWGGTDEENFTEGERRLHREYCHEFQEELTLYEIKLQMKRIRGIYKQEALELIKAGKRENESDLPWFSEADCLFFHTIDWDKEMSKNEIFSSASSDDSSVNSFDMASLTFQSEQLPSLPPTPMLFSSKIAMVSQIPTTTSVSPTTTTSLPYTTSSFLVDNSKPNADRELFVTTVAFPRINPVLTTINSLKGISHLRTTAKFFIIRSPLVRTISSSKIHHPFSPPTCISPATPIPMLPTTKSSAGPLKPNVVSISAQSRLTPTVTSTIYGAASSSTAVSSITFSSVAPSKNKVPLSVVVTARTTRNPGATTPTYSWAKDFNYTNIVPSRVELPVSSYMPEVPLPPVTSFSRTRIPLSQAILSPRTETLTSAATSSRSGVLTSTSPSSRDGVLKSTTSSSSASLRTSVSPSSSAGHTLWPYRHPPTYSSRIPLPSATTSSRSSILKSDPSSSHAGVLKPTAASPMAGLGILPKSPHLNYKERVPLSSSVSPYTNRGGLLQNSPSSRANVRESVAKSSRANIITSVAPSSSSSVSKPSVSSYKTEVPFLPAASTSRAGVSLSSTIPSYRNEDRPSPTVTSSRTGCFPLPTTSSLSTRSPLPPNTSQSSAGVLSPPLTLSTRTSTSAPQSRSLNSPFSPEGPWYF